MQCAIFITYFYYYWVLLNWFFAIIRWESVCIESRCLLSCSVKATSRTPLPASNRISPTSSSDDGGACDRRALPPTVPRGALLQPNHQNAVDRGKAGLSVSTWIEIINPFILLSTYVIILDVQDLKKNKM